MSFFCSQAIAAKEEISKDHVKKDDNGDEKKDVVKEPTTPPESTFKKLAPSRNRYTILRDEL